MLSISVDFSTSLDKLKNNITPKSCSGISNLVWTLDIGAMETPRNPNKNSGAPSASLKSTITNSPLFKYGKIDKQISSIYEILSLVRI